MNNPFKLQTVANQETKLSSIYTNSDIYLYPYARYAFLECLSKLDIKSIYLPAFICRDMLAPINTLGLEYFFYEVDKSLNPKLENVKCDAVLMVDYFGFSMDIKPFLEYKSIFNAIIIEDNAHGFLSKDKNGVLLGTRGDIGLLSIRKTIFLPNGGALLVNNPQYKKINFVCAEPNITTEDVAYQKKYKLKTRLMSKYVGIMILLLRRLIRFAKTGYTLPLPDAQSEKQMPSNYNLTPILRNGTINIDVQKEIQRRQQMYSQISEFAKKYNIEPIYQLDDNSVPFEFAFIDNGKSNEFERFLFTKGFFILPWPDLPDEVVYNCEDFYKRVKVVPFLW